jgi:hypothetical protein
LYFLKFAEFLQAKTVKGTRIWKVIKANYFQAIQFSGKLNWKTFIIEMKFSTDKYFTFREAGQRASRRIIDESEWNRAKWARLLEICVGRLILSGIVG